MADSERAHARFDADQLELIASFIRIERDLLQRHTKRLAAGTSAASGGSTPR
jgi:hypothetical protein